MIHMIVNTVVFAVLGLAIMLLGYLVIEKLTPEKTWREISENKNTALAIVVASLILGISVIISAAIHG